MKKDFRLKREGRKFWVKWRNAVRGDACYQRKASSIKGGADLILVVGAESTATRFFSRVLTGHESILGEEKPESHSDLFDPIWQGLEEGLSREQLKELFPQKKSSAYCLTRRSIPHAVIPGTAAESFEFPPLVEFVELAKAQGFNPMFLVTVRSPVPNLMSWKEQRASGKGSFKMALEQYQDVYPYIFDAIYRTNSAYFILPLEALLVDGISFIQSLFSLLGLDALPEVEVPDIKQGVNDQYYSE